MKLTKLHFFSGITISLFVGLHLFNHIYSLLGAAAHIELMNDLRIVYRNVIVEAVLLVAVVIQIGSGIKLFLQKRKTNSDFFGKLQIYTGMYLAFFLVIHVSAVLAGRLVLDLDTNFYFGVAGLNTFPLNFFFIPYYTLAIISFFGHIAAIHSVKMKSELFGINTSRQSFGILILGIIFSLVVLFGLTNGFTGVEIPSEYDIIIGK